MQTERYNGWTNYETWLVNLWMDNDQGSYEYNRERAQELYDSSEADDISTREQVAARELADQIKDEYETAAGELSGVTGFWADLINASLSAVNWDEIADHLISDTDKEEAEEAA